MSTVRLSRLSPTLRRWGLVSLALAALALVGWRWLRPTEPASSGDANATQATQPAKFAATPPAAPAVSNLPAPTTPDAPASPAAQRPLAVVKETATHQWTAEDARETNVIRRLAHNDLEYQRMVEENHRIQRRQLVYRKDTAAAVLQRARLSGESVQQLTLPGLDGREFQFAIDRADLAPSQQTGSFTGQLAGRPNSLVTLAFKFGREAFTILSPDDGVYLQAHPREPGELIITSFDPDAYQPVPGGEPIRTTQK